jgi:hypothetical protein
MLLRDVHEVLKTQRCGAAILRQVCSGTCGQRMLLRKMLPFESAYLATELWWSDEQDEAVEILVKLSESQKG